MPITNEGCILSGTALEDAKKTGYTNPVIATFTDFQWKRNYNFNIAKSTVENATPSVTYEAIRAACATQSAVDDDVFDSAGTVTVYAEVTKIVLNSDPEFGATAESYDCQLISFSKIA